MEEDFETVILVDPDGNEVEFEWLDTIDYEDSKYVVLLPVESEDNEEDTVMIMEMVEDPDAADDEDSYLFTAVEGEGVLDAVFEIFKQNNEEEFEFEE